MHNRIDTMSPAAPGGAIGARVRRARPPWRGIAAVAVVLCLAGAGIGGYLIGNSPETDLEAVRSSAAAQGRAEGLEQGTNEGYELGYQSAQRGAYGPVYRDAYKRAYAAEFQAVGLEPPGHVRVPKPR